MTQHYAALGHLSAGYHLPLWATAPVQLLRSTPEGKVVSAAHLNASWTSTCSSTSCVKLGHKIILAMILCLLVLKFFFGNSSALNCYSWVCEFVPSWGVSRDLRLELFCLKIFLVNTFPHGIKWLFFLTVCWSFISSPRYCCKWWNVTPNW